MFAELAKECNRALNRRGQTMVWLPAAPGSQLERARDYILAGHVDGVVALNTAVFGASLVRQLAERVPVVAGATSGSMGPDVVCVGLDESLGMQRATRHLVEQGCTRIAHVTGPPDAMGRNLRLEGFRSAVGELFDPDLVVVGDYSTQTGYEQLRRLLQRRSIDGVAAANDLSAFGCLQALQERGLGVPDDVKVVGFDNVPESATRTPALTTVAQDFVRLAEAMADSLIALVSGERPSDVVIDMELIRRDTA